MKGRRVVVASLTAGLVLAGVAGVVQLASAAPPAGYKCGRGGKKNAAKQRCDCPAGKQSSRNTADEAVCKPKLRDTVVGALGSCPGGMVLVPGGSFLMGSPEGVGDGDERPQRRVTLSPYCLDRTEVTVAAYEACGTCASAATTVEWPALSDATRKAFDEAKVCNGNRADRRDHPANCITWLQADDYCRAVAKRLPTEAEWEFAARGTDGRLYPWGTKAPSARPLNACGSECRAFGKRLGFDWGGMYEEEDGHAATAPVGSYPDGASPFGVVDLAGNVWEWVADEYAPYPAGAVTDPRPATTSGAAADKTYSLRGGGWRDFDPSVVRAANRSWYAPSVRVFSLGFRCARGF